MYYGPELTSRHYLAWFIEQKIAAIHIQPGRPMQNGHVESFHGRLRDECLNVNWFLNLWDARRKIDAWRIHYNTERPHSRLGYRTPEEFARTLAPSPSSGFESRKPPAASRPSPAGACGDLDPAVPLRGGPNMTAKGLCEVVEWCGRKLGSRQQKESEALHWRALHGLERIAVSRKSSSRPRPSP
jgi:hypothetical protein